MVPENEYDDYDYDDDSDEYCYLCGAFLTELDFEADNFDDESGMTICIDCAERY